MKAIVLQLYNLIHAHSILSLCAIKGVDTVECHKLYGVQIFFAAGLIWSAILCHADQQHHLALELQLH